MFLQVEEVTTAEGLAAVIPVEWEAYESPHNAFWEVLKGESIEECTGRQWWLHENTPGSRWIKVTDTDTGNIVGAANWVINKENPFKEPGALPKATWWSSAAIQDIGSQFLEQFYGPRPMRMSRPHVLLNILFVSQKSRRQGIGRMMMEWGVKIADEHGLESFIEATQSGIPLYLSFGYVPVGHVFLTADNTTPTPEWTAAYEKIHPEPCRVEVMWRPKGGKFVPGETKYTWEEL